MPRKGANETNYSLTASLDAFLGILWTLHIGEEDTKEVFPFNRKEVRNDGADIVI